MTFQGDPTGGGPAVAWRKVIVLSVFVVVMFGLAWTVYRLRDAFPDVFLWVGALGVPMLIGLAIWDRIRQRRERQVEQEGSQAYPRDDS